MCACVWHCVRTCSWLRSCTVITVKAKKMCFNIHLKWIQSYRKMYVCLGCDLSGKLIHSSLFLFITLWNGFWMQHFIDETLFGFIPHAMCVIFNYRALWSLVLLLYSFILFVWTFVCEFSCWWSCFTMQTIYTNSHPHSHPCTRTLIRAQTFCLHRNITESRDILIRWSCCWWWYDLNQ